MHLFHLSQLLLALPLSAAQPLADQAPLAAAPLPSHNRPRPPPIGHLPVMSSPTVDIKVQPAVSLADVLGPNRALTIFSSLSRQHGTTSSLLADRAADPPLTVLAPINSAFDALPRKPWEQPGDADHADSFAGPDGKDRADGNLRRLVDAHIVRAGSWKKGDKAATLAGREIWWEERDGKKIVMPDKIEVDRVASRVGNGELVSF